MPLRIFIGSASEAKEYMDAVQSILEKAGHTVRPWTRAFPPGPTFIESLEKNVAECDAAFFIASAVDVGIVRGKKALAPRDNVLFEYGMFMARHGRNRVALATLEDEAPKLPSDLDGVTHLALKKPRPTATFNKLNGEAIRDWLAGIAAQPAGHRQLYRPINVKVGAIDALLTNEIVPRIERASEIDLLSLYREINIHRRLDPFRCSKRNKLRMCFLDARDRDLVGMYQRKVGDKRDQPYMQDAIKVAIERFVGTASFDSKLRVKPNTTPAAEYDIRLTPQRITYDYCRVDDVALIIPLDMKKSQDPQPPAWLINRDEHPDVFSFYFGDFSELFTNADCIYSSRRPAKK